MLRDLARAWARALAPLGLLSLILSFAASSAAQAPSPRDTAPTGTGPPDVAPWQQLLTTYATDDGRFGYAALRSNAADRAALDRFVTEIARARPAGWSRGAQLAFYVNAYNARTVKAVVDRWPIESVEDVPGFFDRVRHRVAGRRVTLNQLENDVLRSDRFEEPRVHFAINCASRSCPPLSRRAYTAANVESQLARQTRAFVRGTTRRTDGGLAVSRIFEWYADDFGGEAGVRRFVASRLEGALAAAARDEDAPIHYAPYDWTLNAR